ncbi:uncharacterized protein [Coffea arabica]
MQYDPYSNGYDQGWWDNSSFDYATGPMDFQQQESQQPSSLSGYQQQYQPRPPPPPSSGPSLEEMIKQVMTNMAQNQQRTEAILMQNQQRTDSEMQDIRNQISQMATTINRLDSQNQGELPSQPELNPKNVSAMTLRSGKEVQGPEPVIPKDKDEEMQECQNEKSTDAVEKEAENEEMEPQPQPIEVKESSEESSNVVTPPPFPNPHFLNFYSMISVNEIDFVIPEVFESHGRNKLRVAMVKYLEPLSALDGGVEEKLRSLLDYLAPSTNPWKTVTRVLKDYSIYEGYQDHIEDEALRRATRFYPP